MTYHGFGTTYYGRADVGSDGSSISTEWITAAYIPLFPLGSYRLPAHPKLEVYVAGVHVEDRTPIEKLPLRWSQVLGTYLFLVLVGAWSTVATWFTFVRHDIAVDPNAPWIVSGWVLAMAAPFAWLLFLRREATRAQNAQERFTNPR